LVYLVIKIEHIQLSSLFVYALEVAGFAEAREIRIFFPKKPISLVVHLQF